jgi:hypothetical protein
MKASLTLGRIAHHQRLLNLPIDRSHRPLDRPRVHRIQQRAQVGKLPIQRQGKVVALVRPEPRRNAQHRHNGGDTPQDPSSPTDSSHDS